MVRDGYWYAISLLLVAAVVRFFTADWFASWLLVAIPVAGPLAVVLVWAVSAIFLVIAWLVLVVKALQGEMFRLPIIGGFAEKHAEMTQL